MTRIHTFSDLHFEHMNNNQREDFLKKLKKLFKSDPVDTLVMAGDICQIDTKNSSLWHRCMKDICDIYKNVIYVAGNHESYGNLYTPGNGSISWTTEFLKKHNLKNLIVLDCDNEYTIGGNIFVGDTMWFPNNDDFLAKSMMCDFETIDNIDEESSKSHSNFRNLLASRVSRDTVVVSHHMPLPGCVAPKYKGSILNDFFMTDVSELLLADTLPKLWIHGHTHDHIDFIHKNGDSQMRVYCNPHGYPFEKANVHFWERIAIDI